MDKMDTNQGREIKTLNKENHVVPFRYKRRRHNSCCQILRLKNHINVQFGTSLHDLLRHELRLHT